MVSRNIKAVIEIGGGVAASLPSSVKRAQSELKGLQDAQRGDVTRLRELRQSLGFAAEGSEQYARRQREIARVQESLNFRTDKIQAARQALGNAGGATAGLTGRLSALRAGLGPVGLAAGAVVGVITGLAAAFRSAGRDANNLISTAALYGRTVEDIQRRRNLFQYFTQDADRAQAAARNLLEVQDQFQRIRFGAGAGPEQIFAAQRLRIEPGELASGDLGQRELLERLIAGFQALGPTEGRLRLEQAGFGEDVQAAVAVGSREGLSAAVQYQARQAVLSREQLAANRDMGRNIGEMLSQIKRLVQIALASIASPLISMSTFLLRLLGGEKGALEAERVELISRRQEIVDRQENLRESVNRDESVNRRETLDRQENLRESVNRDESVNRRETLDRQEIVNRRENLVSSSVSPYDVAADQQLLRAGDQEIERIDQRLRTIADRLPTAGGFGESLNNVGGTGLSAKDLLDIATLGATGNPIPNLEITNIFDTAGQTSQDVARAISDGILDHIPFAGRGG